MNEKKSKKYEIIKNGTDDYTLKYKDKELNFNSKVEFVYDLQEIIKNGRLNMVSDLAKKGMTVDNLIIKKEVNGVITEDHSTKDYIENAYIQDEQISVFDNVLKKMFGKGYLELASELELNEEESKQFGKDIGVILRGETPSK